MTELVEAVRAAGGAILRDAADNSWGGYSASFTDPDGNAWNVGFNIEFYRA